MSSKILSLCSRASVRLGCEPILSFSDDNTSAQLAKSLFQTIYEVELSNYPWKFSITQKKLNKLAGDKPLEWDYKYSLPLDMLRLERVFNLQQTNITEYKIVGKHLLTNISEVYLEYCYPVPFEQVPAYFEQYIEYLLAAHLAIPLTEQTQKANLYRQLAREQFINASYLDSQSQVDEVLDLSFILSARN